MFEALAVVARGLGRSRLSGCGSRGQDQCGQATKGVWGMPRRQKATKGVLRLRYARGSRQKGVDPGMPESACAESIGARGEPRELKHLSTWRKRKQPRFRQ
jgi:hypothetical protein